MLRANLSILGPLRAASSAILLLTLVIPSLNGTPVADETTIEGNETWSGPKVVSGTLRLVDGAVLTLEGAQVTFGGMVVVEPGATLRLVPAGARATTLAPIGPSAEFWIDVAGDIEASGSPGTAISGLWGHGLASAEALIGGLQVKGHANLSGLQIERGTAGLVVAPGGELMLRNASLSETSEVGLAVRGNAELDNVTIRKNSLFALAGKDTCDISARHLTVDSGGSSVIINSCRFALSKSLLMNGQVPLTATGSAKVEISDTRIANYSVDGLSSSYIPGRANPEVVLHNVTLEAGATGNLGLDFSQAIATIDGLTVRGTAGDGIFARQSIISVANSTIEANGGWGIIAIGGDLRVELASTSFGTQVDGTNNTRGAVRHMALLEVQAIDPQRHDEPIPLDVTILGASGPSPVSKGSSPSGQVSLQFDTYGTSPAGDVVYYGPFRYEADVDGAERSGSIESLAMPLVISPQENVATAADVDLARWTLIGIGAIFFVASIAWGRWNRKRGGTTTDDKQETPSDGKTE